MTTMIGAEGLTQAVPTTPREWAAYFHHSNCHATSSHGGAGVAANVSAQKAPRGAEAESVTDIEGLHRCTQPPLAGAWESWALTDLGYTVPECGDLGGMWGGAYSALSDAALVQDMLRLYTNEAVWHTCQANGYRLLRQLCDPNDLDELQVGTSLHRVRTCIHPVSCMTWACVLHAHPAIPAATHHVSRCNHTETLYCTALSDPPSHQPINWFTTQM